MASRYPRLQQVGSPRLRRRPKACEEVSSALGGDDGRRLLDRVRDDAAGTLPSPLRRQTQRNAPGRRPVAAPPHGAGAPVLFPANIACVKDRKYLVGNEAPPEFVVLPRNWSELLDIHSVRHN